jgi:hypothetical protein
VFHCVPHTPHTHHHFTPPCRCPGRKTKVPGQVGVGVGISLAPQLARLGPPPYPHYLIIRPTTPPTSSLPDPLLPLPTHFRRLEPRAAPPSRQAMRSSCRASSADSRSRSPRSSADPAASRRRDSCRGQREWSWGVRGGGGVCGGGCHGPSSQVSGTAQCCPGCSYACVKASFHIHAHSLNPNKEEVASSPEGAPPRIESSKYLNLLVRYTICNQTTR